MPEMKEKSTAYHPTPKKPNSNAKTQYLDPALLAEEIMIKKGFKLHERPEESETEDMEEDLELEAIIKELEEELESSDIGTGDNKGDMADDHTEDPGEGELTAEGEEDKSGGQDNKYKYFEATYVNPTELEEKDHLEGFVIAEEDEDEQKFDS